jgi:hypothetical protein
VSGPVETQRRTRAVPARCPPGRGIPRCGAQRRLSSMLRAKGIDPRNMKENFVL